MGFDRQVTVQVQYWDKDFPNERKNYPDDITAVNASDGQLTFYDNSITSVYVFTLIVHENGQQNARVFAESDSVWPFDVDNSDDDENTRKFRKLLVIVCIFEKVMHDHVYL